MSEEEIQQKYYEFQILNEHIQKIQQQITLVKKQIEELEKVNSAISIISSSESGTPLLCPVGAGVYAKAEIKDSKEIIMAVGANVCVAKKAEEAKEQVKIQLEEMNEIMAQLENELALKTKELQVLQQNLRNRISENSKQSHRHSHK